jgi:prophage regulatory protein
MNTNDLNKTHDHGNRLAIQRIRIIKGRTGLSRSSIYKKMNDGTFPRQISLGLRSVGWLESDIDDWIANRVQASSTLAAGGRHD